MRKLLFSLVIFTAFNSWAEAQPEPQKAPDLKLPATPSKVDTPSPMNMPAGPKS